MVIIGTITAFDRGVEHWEAYIERVELYCDSNSINDLKSQCLTQC